MAKIFETVKKGTTLLLNGKFNNEVGEVIATVTYTEVYGDEMRITYKGTTRNGCFTHTITVNKKFGRERVMIHEHEWKNFRWTHLLWLQKTNTMCNRSTLEYFTNREKSTRTLIKAVEFKYDYVVKVLY